MSQKTIDSYFEKVEDHRYHNKLHKLIDRTFRTLKRQKD
jgi:hypothetical protein